MHLLLGIIIGLLCGALGGAGVLVVLRRRDRGREEDGITSARKQAQQILDTALKNADEARKQAAEEVRDIERRVREYEDEIRRERAEQQKQEQRLLKKEEGIDKRLDQVAAKEEDLQRRERDLVQSEKDALRLEADYRHLTTQARETLEKVAGMSSEDAKRAMVEELVAEAKLDAARHLRVVEEEAKEQAERSAKKIISTALSPYAGEFVVEQVVTTVPIPTEEMKGRIIGREGRNIRAFEAATGVDLIIDDTPEAVVISCFSAVRREVARRSLDKLVSDGRIHPSRIDELVKKSQKEVDQLIKEAGERAAEELGVFGLHPELIKQIGKLRYRTSYGQNVLAHSVEVAHLAGLLAGELGMNVKVARRAALLHDIGKAADQENEGPHHIVGAQVAKRFGEAPQVVHAIRAHHEEPETVLDHIIIAADATSGARPGARRELLESYLKRLEDLEAIPRSFKGINEAFAFQAGREIRVLVNPDVIGDAELTILCRDIAQKIEQDLTYPGQIKVSVIRQTRVEDVAK